MIGTLIIYFLGMECEMILQIIKLQQMFLLLPWMKLSTR